MCLVPVAHAALVAYRLGRWCECCCCCSGFVHHSILSDEVCATAAAALVPKARPLKLA